MKIRSGFVSNSSSSSFIVDKSLNMKEAITKALNECAYMEVLKISKINDREYMCAVKDKAGAVYPYYMCSYFKYRNKYGYIICDDDGNWEDLKENEKALYTENGSGTFEEYLKEDKFNERFEWMPIPRDILSVLTPTDNEVVMEYRKFCFDKNFKRK